MTWLARLRNLPGLRSWSMRPLPTLCAAAITVAALWSLFGQLEVVSHTTGRVAPDSQVRPVQHLEGGVVDRILVQEGQPVTRDQVLVTLDVTEAAANARSIQYRLDSYRIDIIRLQAELDGDKPPLIPPDLARRASETAVQALGLFTARRDLLDRKLAVQRQLVLQRRSDSAQISERRAVNGEILKLVEEQIEISKRLLQRDVTNRMAHIELLRDRANLMRQLGEDRALAVKTAAMTEEAEQHLAEIRAQYVEDARSKMEESRRKIDELNQELRRYEDRLTRARLRAPVDGVVKSISVTNPGSVVKAGETVVEVVPSDDRLVVEARLPVDDIGHVTVGLRANIRLMSGEATRYGAISGGVTSVGADTLTSDKGVAYYKVVILPDSPAFRRDATVYRLYPGLAVEASIIIGTRSIAEYLLGPLVGSFGGALQEP